MCSAPEPSWDRVLDTVGIGERIYVRIYSISDASRQHNEIGEICVDLTTNVWLHCHCGVDVQLRNETV